MKYDNKKKIVDAEKPSGLDMNPFIFGYDLVLDSFFWALALFVLKELKYFSL